MGSAIQGAIFGKKIVCGCDIKDSGVWPYNTEKKYIDFIIGLDEDGNEIKYTSDPSKLSSYLEQILMRLII